jgi:thioredoxin reductase (NADPH)
MVPMQGILSGSDGARTSPSDLLKSQQSAHHWAMSEPTHADRSTQADSALREVDCAIVGGGAAGLSAAINLGRMRRSVIVVDDKDRFRWRHPINNYLGFPDGTTAAELRRLGRRQAARFGARFVIGHVTAAAPDGDRFRLRIEALRAIGPATDSPDEELIRTSDVVPAGGRIDLLARSVILAMGVRGHFPDFPGRDACVGISLFWCIQCDGYESIDRVVGVVGHDEAAVEMALDLLDFTSHVTLVAGRPEGFSVPPSRLADVSAAGVEFHPHGVAEYQNSDGHMQALLLDDPARTRIQLEQVYTVRPSLATNAIASQLGVALTEIGQVIVDTDQHTNIPGVLAAGDITAPHDHQFSAAVHEGNQAACAANYRLYRPEQRAPDAEDC